jgi:hypothetical protein
MFKKIIGNVNLITIDDFYQAQPTRDKWIFEKLNENIHARASIFCENNVQCYELKQIMC